MGSLRFGGVLFCIYSHDHPPAHVHAYVDNVMVILDLLANGGMIVSKRSQMSYIKRGDLRRILRAAERHEAELRELWRRTHGPSSQS